MYIKKFSHSIIQYFFTSTEMIHSRVTSATILVDWNTRIHTHAVLVYGKNPSQSKNYEEYAKKITTRTWDLEETVRAFWGKGPRIPAKVFQYFHKNPVTTKPKGFENGIRIQFDFGVVKLFDTGKALLTVSLKNIPREYIPFTIKQYARKVHQYIQDISKEDDLQWYATQLDVQDYSLKIVSLNSTTSLFDNGVDLDDFYTFCVKNNVSSFYDSEFHRGHLQLFIHCDTKKNTICIYHTGKCVIMGIQSLESLVNIEEKINKILGGYELYKIEKILLQ